MLAKIERFGNLVGAYLSLVTVMSIAVAWVLKLTKPFKETGWGWPEAILIGLAVALVTSLAVSAALVAWRYFRPGSAQTEVAAPETPSLADRVGQLEYEMQQLQRLHRQCYEEHTQRLDQMGKADATYRGAIAQEMGALPTLARIAYLKRKQEQYAYIKAQADGAMAEWSALASDPAVIPGSPQWQRWGEAYGEWHVAMVDFENLISRVLRCGEVMIRQTPNYTQNPMRAVPGDEHIANEEKRQDFRRISDMREHAENQVVQFGHRLSSEINGLRNKLDGVVEANPQA